MMYTKKELAAARRVISKVADKNHVPEAQVRADMLKAMNAGRNVSDPEVRARWKAFYYAGAEPTVEEFILWLSKLAAKRLAP